MEKKLFKSILLIITYSIFLVLIVININFVLGAIKSLLVILIPLFIGIAIAFIINRPYSFFLRNYSKILKFKSGYNISKGLSLITVILIFVGTFSAIVTFIIPQLSESLKILYGNIQEYSGKLEEYRGVILYYIPIEKINFSDFDSIINSVPKVTSSLAKGIFPQIYDFTAGIIRSFANLILGLILALYLLFDKERLIKQLNDLLRAYSPRKAYIKIIKIFTVINHTFSQFITGQFIEVIILGILCFLGMIIFGFEYPLLISLIIALTTFIPFVGPIIGIIPSALILLINDPIQALWFIVFIIVLQQIEGNFIYPRVVGSSVQLSPLMVLLAIIIGGGLFGIIGMIVGIPVMSVVYKLLKEDIRDRIDRYC